MRRTKESSASGSMPSATVMMEGLESAFRHFGGVPSELLFDQMKAVVVEDRRGVGGRLMENPEFLRFAFHSSRLL